jgi:hypothetical protein
MIYLKLNEGRNMPELNQVIEKKHAKAAVVAKTVTVKAPPKIAKPIEATVIDDTDDKPKKIEAEVKQEKHKVVVEKKETEIKEEKYVRPPIEQITRDFDAYVETLSIADKNLKKLGYKCGKIIFGLPADGTGKDFRVIAYKARKKTKSVSGKSRVIFYFGINKETKKHVKEILGTSSSKFGRCSVQISDPIEPIEFKLDKTIFSETFDKDVTKVMDSLKKLCAITIEQKSSVFNELKEKKEKKDTE